MFRWKIISNLHQSYWLLFRFLSQKLLVIPWKWSNNQIRFAIRLDQKETKPLNIKMSALFMRSKRIWWRWANWFWLWPATPCWPCSARTCPPPWTSSPRTTRLTYAISSCRFTHVSHILSYLFVHLRWNKCLRYVVCLIESLATLPNFFIH